MLDSLGITYPGGYTDDVQVVYNYPIRAGQPLSSFSFEGHVLRVWTGSINRDQLEVTAAAILEGE